MQWISAFFQHGTLPPQFPSLPLHDALPISIGATVSIQHGGIRQTDAVLSQSSFLSANDIRLHFGLGAVEAVDHITVRWPSGATEGQRTEIGRAHV